MPIVPLHDIHQVQLHFEKTLTTRKNSIFYTLIPTQDEGFLGFYRIHYAGQGLGLATYDNNLIPLQDHGYVADGEDPRSFKHGAQWYLTSNVFNANKFMRLNLMDSEINLTAQYGRESGDANYPNGKNPSYISYNGNLYLVKWFYPLEIFQFDENLSLVQLKYKKLEPADDKYRGGTPGYATGVEGEFIGFGHYTVVEDDTLSHFPFIWKLDLKTLSLDTRVLRDIYPASPICDPIAIIKMGKAFYLVTAESDYGWDREQEYLTSIWKIEF